MNLLIPIIIVAASLILAHYVINKLTLSLDISKVFNSEPDNSSAEGIEIKVNGIEGDHLLLGFKGFDTVSDSEQIFMTQKNISEVKSALDTIEIDKWELISKIPQSILRYDVIIYTSPNTPNNTQSTLRLLVKKDNLESKLGANERMVMLQSIKFNHLLSALSEIEISLSYGLPITQKFFDVNGEFVSQASGYIKLKPTFGSQFIIIIGSWVFVMGFLILLKEFLISSKTFAEVYDLFTKNN